MKKQLIWFALIAVLSCKQNEIEPVDIFIGLESGFITKNGNSILYNRRFYGSNAFFANEKNIYIGEIPPSGTPVAQILNNGQAIHTETGRSFVQIHDIYAVEDDWYAVGSITDSTSRTASILWKNGNKQVLSPPSFGWKAAIGVVATMTDVFVIGTDRAFWKNGQLLTILGAKEFSDILLDGQDVYLSGMNNANEYQLWKNGMPMDMSNFFTRTSPNERIYDFFVENGDIYFLVTGRVATTGNTEYSWWKNGQKNILLSVQSVNSAYASDMFVKYGQVYITGYEATTDCQTKAQLWRNGTSIAVQTGLDCGSAQWVFVR